MKPKRQRFGSGGMLGICLLLMGLTLSARAASVRGVDYGGKPEWKEMADHMRQFGDEMYPRVLELLDDGKTKLPRQFDVVFTTNMARLTRGPEKAAAAYATE